MTDENDKAQINQPSAREVAAALAARKRLGIDPASPAPEDGRREPEGMLPTGQEPEKAEVEYLTRDELPPVDGSAEDVVASLSSSLRQPSSEWLSLCEALTQCRRLAAHRSPALLPALEEVMPLVCDCARSLRSAVCKTALMTAADLAYGYGAAVLPALEKGSLLLLLKQAAADKRFVQQAAKSALGELTAAIPSRQLLALLLAHTKEKNPKLRAAAATAMAETLERLVSTADSTTEISKVEISAWLNLGASLLSDRQQPARQAARSILSAVRQLPFNEGDDSWEKICGRVLDSTSLAAVLKLKL
mmetsp:Transcript_16741/g.54734  ORF Transcript_16741/g.54734 Transcript_16741/m.54734 type:complete len:305 (-) Transcript_16741:91-1005(-)|eukprot:CAMPEP_0170152016 /NCGR_PEP_ID=MMETSP0033_2-20121228/51298_1 /TAXON_ID=195969 /ORGANISM="Dolichomastix tenuilepis, Strain CCMP3274" /LENGTH=304 /DNA_ID=CAMNT_0010389141 /DNA_START=15 /DNA_END=929 /DNA_ORIENTATION=+